jgi:hypothetical protein
MLTRDRNYGSAILGFILIAATLWWFAWGRGRFYGPVDEIPGITMANHGDLAIWNSNAIEGKTGGEVGLEAVIPGRHTDSSVDSKR